MHVPFCLHVQGTLVGLVVQEIPTNKMEKN